MGESRRVNRVEKELHQVIASFLLTGFKFPLYGLVSVSRVQVSPDLKSARVFVSFMGTEKDKIESLENLQDNVRDIQFEVSKKIQMKFCPKLKIIEDKGMEHQLKVEKILSDIKTQGSSDD